MKRSYRIACAALALLLFLPAHPRRNKRTLPEPEEAVEYAPGTFTVSTDCEDCHDGYRLSQVQFAGYDKPAASSVETLFIANGTDRTLRGVSFFITYLSESGAELHKRFVKLDVEIPAGERRMVSFRSWDVQNSFRYVKSRESRRATTPYEVTVDPVSIRLSFGDAIAAPASE